jgi:hypothetical protein
VYLNVLFDPLSSKLLAKPKHFSFNIPPLSELLLLKVDQIFAFLEGFSFSFQSLTPGFNALSRLFRCESSFQ